MPDQTARDPRYLRLRSLLLVGTTSAILIVIPLSAEQGSFDFVWHMALAKDGNGNGAAGNGHGGGRIDQAEAHYRDALGGRHDGRGPRGEGAPSLEREVGPVAQRFSAQETRQLIERGWRAHQLSDAGFRNHGQRVRTMVELARRLGYGARVGALQASFGTPQENGIADLTAELADARAELEANPDDPEAAAWVEGLEADIAAALVAAKPGRGADDSDESWATADLDVNQDGLVDPQDLAALDAQQVVPAGATDR